MSVPEPSISLAECLQGLLHLPHHLGDKKMSQVYVAALGFLCHLKRDQATLHQLKRENGAFPSYDKIPAMGAVLQDPNLFHTLLSCLKSSPVETGSSDGGSMAHQAGRKRSYSFQAPETEPNKHQKLQHSPMVRRGAPSSGADGANSLEVKIPVHVVAATILYAAFQHLDHWPAPLMHAYAEDCFGSRSWVDDERCALLVQNLALVHTSDVDEHMLDEPDLLDARRVAHFYSHEMKLAPGKTELSAPATYTEQRFHRGSLTSSVSSSTGRPHSQSNASDGPPASDSDCDDECLVEISSGALERAGHGEIDGSSSSSSSGEEDEEVLGTAESFANAANGTSEPGTNSGTSQLDPQLTFPAAPKSIDLQRVRPRYIGDNLDEAHSAIGTALSDRLDAKYKQNSRLVSTLSSFLSVPDVRRLIASSLERWLQSPALSGQARNLFSELVQSFENVDPPLPSDAEAIESVLAMKLKSNQLNMHTENITTIASRLPSQEVARRILRRLLRAEMSSLESAPSGSSSQSLQIIAAVHEVIPARLFAEAFASGLLTLQEDACAATAITATMEEERPHHEIGRIRHLIRSVASTLGTRFDSCAVLESLASASSPNTWTIQDEEDRARILFELALLLVPGGSPGREIKQSARPTSKRQGGRKLLTEEETTQLRAQLLQVRKLLLKWCCIVYAPLWLEQQGELKRRRSRDKNRPARETNGDESLGAGPPDYSSILDENNNDAVSQHCPDVIRCLLFTEGPESDAMLAFLRPTATMGQDFFVEELQYWIDECVQNGNDLDDELIRIILKHTFTAADDSSSSALYLSLIESLFHQCSRGRSNSLRTEDPEIVWELYELAEYCPKSTESVDSSGIPRLAYPGLWWRVTMIALVMCGNSPATIGTEMWHRHPTLQALMKMVTSGRYRFPTVDFDDEERNRIKLEELNVRQEEMRICEQLFLPPLPDPTAEKEDDIEPSWRQGSRASARQREKQERRLREQREKKAAEAAAAAARRKKNLKSAQKSIMMWEPKGHARKPPRESVNLLLSVEELFGLSDRFRQCTDPDYLLLTVGQTTRAAIERASDWLIRVISSYPKIIERLPSSASCFLLLRSYGQSDGQSELRELSAPLLSHVRSSLRGTFGENDSVKAAELLLADMTDKNSDRRRCARRVLQEALDSGDGSAEEVVRDSTGLQSLLHVQHAEAIVSRSQAVENITKATSFEEGEVLCDLIAALDKFVSFANQRGFGSPVSFGTVLCSLLSSRPSVCAEAMDLRPDFLSRAVQIVHQRFAERLCGLKANDSQADTGEDALLTPYTVSPDTSTSKLVIPLPLLHSICVLLSVWNYQEDDIDVDPALRKSMDEMESALLSSSVPSAIDLEKETKGFAGALISSTGKRALTIEHWIMLAKARNDLIARRVALSSPIAFLPRLLLCSGLPQSSLLAMIDRLGELPFQAGNKGQDSDETYRQLFLPSSINEWAYTGSRRDVPRKILGRIAAYKRLQGGTDGYGVSSVFLEWLYKECTAQSEQSSRPKRKGARDAMPPWDVSPISIRDSEVLESIGASSLELDSADIEPVSRKADKFEPKRRNWSITDILTTDDAKRIVDDSIAKADPTLLDSFLDNICSGSIVKSQRLSPQVSTEIATSLLESSLDTDSAAWATSIVKWVPLLTRDSGSPSLWESLFSFGQDSSVTRQIISQCVLLWNEGNLRRCQEWLLSEDVQHKNLETAHVLRFLVATSGQLSLHHREFGDNEPSAYVFMASSPELAKSAVRLALDCAAFAIGIAKSDRTDRNGMPDWLILLLCIARSGKKAMVLVADSLLESLSNKDKSSTVYRCLQSALLRIYTYYPRWMSLGNPFLRDVLMEGAGVIDWRDWRSPLDKTIEGMVLCLAENGDQQTIQSLSKIAKGHPLLLLRKLPFVVATLEEDAFVRHGRGRAKAENIPTFTTAKLPSRLVNVTVVHWGYTFNDTFWSSLVDILLSIPGKVFFGCGMHLGVPSLLGTYMKLIYVHNQLRGSEVRVKTKFSALLAALREHDLEIWTEFLGSTVADLPSLATVRNVLVGCGLMEPSEAIETIRKSR